MTLEAIRRAEAQSHEAAYRELELYAPGSWLSGPVKALSGVLEVLAGPVDALDLGSGVGRNAIAVAKALPGSTVTCVDILPIAIEKLRENAAAHGVAGSIRGILSPVDTFIIEEGRFDLILAASVLEHLDAPAACAAKVREIARGIRPGGAVLVVMNTGILEWDESGKPLPPQFEVNLPPQAAQELLDRAFSGWDILRRTCTHYRYSVPRGTRTVTIESEVITFAARRPHV